MSISPSRCSGTLVRNDAGGAKAAHRAVPAGHCNSSWGSSRRRARPATMSSERHASCGHGPVHTAQEIPVATTELGVGMDAEPDLVRDDDRRRATRRQCRSEGRGRGEDARRPTDRRTRGSRPTASGSRRPRTRRCRRARAQPARSIGSSTVTHSGRPLGAVAVDALGHVGVAWLRRRDVHDGSTGRRRQLHREPALPATGAADEQRAATRPCRSGARPVHDGLDLFTTARPVHARSDHDGRPPGTGAAGTMTMPSSTQSTVTWAP